MRNPGVSLVVIVPLPIAAKIPTITPNIARIHATHPPISVPKKPYSASPDFALQ
jgi:hypothetical protein